jgi:hypothetical protein
MTRSSLLNNMTYTLTKLHQNCDTRGLCVWLAPTQEYNQIRPLSICIQKLIAGALGGCRLGAICVLDTYGCYPENVGNRKYIFFFIQELLKIINNHVYYITFPFLIESICFFLSLTQ